MGRWERSVAQLQWLIRVGLLDESFDTVMVQNLAVHSAP
jgi:hypothetical protein